MIYCDTSYLVRLYLEDAGFNQVRDLCSTDQVSCCLHGKVETVAAFHRRFREGKIGQSELVELIGQFETDSAAGGFVWFPVTDMLVRRLVGHYRKAPANVFLRAADAVHLACAEEHGFAEVFSSDRHLLQAAKLFGLEGRDILLRR